MDGFWKGFRGGGGSEKLFFKAERTLNTFSKTELSATLAGGNGTKFVFAIRGCFSFELSPFIKTNM